MAISGKVSGSFSAEGESEVLTTNGKVAVMIGMEDTAVVTLRCRPEGVTTWFAVKDYEESGCEFAGEDISENAHNLEWSLICSTFDTEAVTYALVG